MRNNLPVTGREFKFDPSARLISSTDLKGRIRFFNKDFQHVSGFSRDELMGAPHNLVRHPDMPPGVYENMWKTLQRGRPWMGLVKNRRKDGDHYWVSAYVTPVFEGAEMVGYESVRVNATEEQKQRAEKVYCRLRAGKKPFSWRQYARYYAEVFSPVWLPGVAAALLAWPFGGASMALTLLALTAVILLAQAWRSEKDYQDLLKLRPEAFTEALVANTYSKDGGSKAQVEMMTRSEAARASTGLTRIADASESLAEVVSSTKEQAATSSRLTDNQNQSTQQAASAIHQMSASIEEVADNVEANSEKAKSAAEYVKQSTDRAKAAMQAINELHDAVKSIVSTVNEVSKSTQEIGQAADLITQIADQTNLLALNAAIEAARAGEHGRGFSVVADEVRALAGKTRESTDRIHTIIGTLRARADNAVEVSEHGESSAKRGVEMVAETEQALREIDAVVSAISDTTLQMSAAVEEQSNVAEHISQQVTDMADGAEEARSNAQGTADASAQLQNTVHELRALIQRFLQKG
ncbi:methyl-accepting chemotaxis protein [Aliidiomarina soli]|uniref:Chemotaxis protein n=1 Tax=Aliidiomarina soli TaxID=1928574 RepID=A0A432WFJ1_9GAMM|nr:methyl-accepting chemotaxis protein [Aliidiomarina soli]RUO32525.1 chemotaxis protein [Aliidiomarina soli]